MKPMKIAFFIAGAGTVAGLAGAGCDSPASRPVPPGSFPAQSPKPAPPDADGASASPPPMSRLPDPVMPPPIPPDPASFVNQVSTAICMRLAGCCGGIDVAACEAATRGGLEGANAEVTDATIERGFIHVDENAALLCLAGIAQLSCPSVGSAELRGLVDTCFNAVVGVLPQGGACVRSIECQQGFFCDFSSGSGVCQATHADGAACGSSPYDTTFASHECTYKGWPSTAQSFCNYDSYPDPSGYVCAPLRAVGATCYTDNECATGICGGASSCDSGGCTCVGEKDLGPYCQAFAMKDAGSD